MNLDRIKLKLFLIQNKLFELDNFSDTISFQIFSEVVSDLLIRSEQLINEFCREFSPYSLLNLGSYLYYRAFRNQEYRIFYLTPKILVFQAIKSLNSNIKFYNGLNHVTIEQEDLIIDVCNQMCQILDFAEAMNDFDVYKQYHPLYSLEMKLLITKRNPFKSNLTNDFISVSMKNYEDNVTFIDNLRNLLSSEEKTKLFNGHDLRYNNNIQELLFVLSILLNEHSLVIDYNNSPSLYNELIKTPAFLFKNNIIEFFDFYLEKLQVFFPEIVKNATNYNYFSKTKFLLNFLKSEFNFSLLYCGESIYFTSNYFLSKYTEMALHSIKKLSSNSDFKSELKDKKRLKQFDKLSTNFNRNLEDQLLLLLENGIFKENCYFLSDINKGMNNHWKSSRQIDFIVLYLHERTNEWYIGIGDHKAHKRREIPMNHFFEYQRFPEEANKKIELTINDIISDFGNFTNFLEDEIQKKYNVLFDTTKLSIAHVIKLLAIYPETLYNHEEIIFISEWTTYHNFKGEIDFLIQRNSLKLKKGFYHLLRYFNNHWKIICCQKDPKLLQHQISKKKYQKDLLYGNLKVKQV